MSKKLKNRNWGMVYLKDERICELATQLAMFDICVKHEIIPTIYNIHHILFPSSDKYRELKKSFDIYYEDYYKELIG